MIEKRYLSGVVGDVQITVLVAVKDAAITTMHLGTFWHIDTQKLFALQDHLIDRKIGRRINLLWIVDGRNKVFADLSHRIRINPLDSAVVLDTEQETAAMPIEKGTDRFINIAVELIFTALKLQIKSFAPTN